MPETKQPSLFISHGAPTLPFEDSLTRDFLVELGERLARPRAILVISAHWESDMVAVTASARPETLHDFDGFPRALYMLRYKASGDPVLAGEIVKSLEAVGIPACEDATRGLDHGAWIPLMLMYPNADIPVLQLALKRDADAGEHLRIGRALAPLRDLGVLIVGSGGLTHNLFELRRGNFGDATADWVQGFADWVNDKVTTGDEAAIAAYRSQAPDALRCHPTEEHFMPLAVAMGAAGQQPGRRAHQETLMAVLSMDAFIFGEPASLNG